MWKATAAILLLSCSIVSCSDQKKSAKCNDEDIEKKGTGINLHAVQADDPKLVDVLKLCKENQECHERAGTYNDASHKSLRLACNSFRLVTTDFYACAQKLIREEPDVSKYSCLKGHDFYDAGSEATCKRFAEKKDCVKTVVKDLCGEKSLERFDENVEVILFMHKCQL